MLFRLNSVLSVFNYLQVQCSLLYVYFYHLLFWSTPSFVPHSVCKPWKEFTWIKFSTSSSNSCMYFFSSLHCIALQSIHSTQRSIGSDNQITTTNKQACGLIDKTSGVWREGGGREVGVGLEFCYLHHVLYFFFGLNRVILIYVLIPGDLLCCSIGWLLGLFWRPRSHWKGWHWYSRWKVYVVGGGCIAAGFSRTESFISRKIKYYLNIACR